MKKFKGKYRIGSIRLQNWDYGGPGCYFITICTKKRMHFFGEIMDGKMQLSEIGKIAENEWLKTFEMRPDMNLKNGAFVVMPDHIHAILGIGKNDYNRYAMHCVSMHCASMHHGFGPQSKNLASVIRGFKIGVTVNARKLNPHFAWQSLYWESIIRNDNAYRRVKKYIINNPKNWV